MHARAEVLSNLRYVLGAADQDAGDEHQHTAQNNLEDGGKKWRVHVALSDPGDGDEFDGDDDNGGDECNVEVFDQKWQRMTDSSGSSHEPSYCAAKDGAAATS